MFHVLKAISLLILYLLIYLSFGSLLLKQCQSVCFSFAKAIALGFFVYFGCFQIIAIPFTLLLFPLHILTFTWSILVFVVVFTSCIQNVKHWLKYAKDWYHTYKHPALVILLGFVVLECLFVWVNASLTWDSTYYIGVVSTALQTDTLYQIDPYTGNADKILNLRYALATLGTHSAVFCKLFHIHPLIEMKLTVGTIDVLLSNCIVYEIAKTIFMKKRYLWYLIPALNILFVFWFYTPYSESLFLLFRGYEGKAFCGNVIIPMAIWICINLWRDIQNKDYWAMLFVLTFACNTISMSSMVIIAVLLAAFLLPTIFLEKQYQRIWTLLICEMPCLIVCLIMLLYRKQLLYIYI